MAETRTGGQPEQSLAPHERRMLKETARRTLLMDLVHGDLVNPPTGYRESDFQLPANYIHELIIETGIGKLLPMPGTPLTRARIRDLFEPGEFGQPKARRLPDNALLRRTITNPDETEAPNHWSRELGVVFRYDNKLDYRTVTGEIEIGIGFSGAASFNAYRRSCILIDDILFLIEDAERFRVSAAEVDEYLGNIANLTRTPKTVVAPEVFAGIDLSGWPGDFGDKINL